jgi:hypothetical protein
MLLNRVVPPADILAIAVYYGHKEIVEMLLKDNRVDPSADGSCALRNASLNGHKEIVEILLKDNRVDSSKLQPEPKVE